MTEENYPCASEMANGEAGYAARIRGNNNNNNNNNNNYNIRLSPRPFHLPHQGKSWGKKSKTPLRRI